MYASVLLCPVVGRSRPAVVACCTVRSGVFHHWIHHLWPQGAVPPGFNPLRRGWVYRPAPEAPRKGECRRGPRHFWNCLSRLGFGPATGPTLKTALCHIRTLVGRRINTAHVWNIMSFVLHFGCKIISFLNIQPFYPCQQKQLQFNPFLFGLVPD